MNPQIIQHQETILFGQTELRVSRSPGVGFDKRSKSSIAGPSSTKVNPNYQFQMGKSILGHFGGQTNKDHINVDWNHKFVDFNAYLSSLIRIALQSFLVSSGKYMGGQTMDIPAGLSGKSTRVLWFL